MLGIGGDEMDKRKTKKQLGLLIIVGIVLLIIGVLVLVLAKSVPIGVPILIIGILLILGGGYGIYRYNSAGPGGGKRTM